MKVAEVDEKKIESHEDKEYEDKTCPSYDKVIAPKIAQNINGKYIQHTCSSHGSSCLGCLPLDMDHQHVPDKMCQQEYREVEMLVIGDNGKDLVTDTFMMPDGCKCLSR